MNKELLDYVGENNGEYVKVTNEKLISGIMNLRTKKMIIPLKYDYIEGYTDGHWLCYDYDNNKVCLINSKGIIEWSLLKFEDVRPIDSHIYPFKYSNLLFIKKDGCNIVYNTKEKKEIMKIQGEKDLVIINMIDKKYFVFYIDKPLKYYTENFPMLKRGIMDIHGNVILRPIYTWISCYNNSTLILSTGEFPDSKVVLYDLKSRKIISRSYNSITYKHKHFFGMGLNDNSDIVRNDILDISGKNIIYSYNSRLQLIYKDILIPYNSNKDTNQFEDINGNKIMDIKFKSAHIIKDYYVRIIKNDKYAIVNLKDKKVYSFYDKMENLDNGLCLVSLNNKWGVIDINDNIKIPIKYGLLQSNPTNFLCDGNKYLYTLKKGIPYFIDLETFKEREFNIKVKLSDMIQTLYLDKYKDDILIFIKGGDMGFYTYNSILNDNLKYRNTKLYMEILDLVYFYEKIDYD